VQASTHARVGGRVYVVEKGDTLFDIARYELGKPSRWAEIYDLNQDVLGDDFHFLEPGTELVLPSDRPEESLTKQREGTLKR
jgi:nucleoid-associated protein YgaU